MILGKVLGFYFYCRKHASCKFFVEWADFSPYEVAIPKYGVSIPSEYFDSEFFMGRRVKRLPESRICYLEGDITVPCS